jgi:PKHD-type hydroxylase
MLLRIPELLSPAALEACRKLIDGADWTDGKLTAGLQSARVKNNRQLPEDDAAARAARAIVIEALGKSALFMTGALPKKTYPPLFNRYDGAANAFGSHIDNAVRTSAVTGSWVRTDLSATLFLSDPASYDGGELVMEGSFGSQEVKLAAGDLILYPASSRHQVMPVTRGTRLACFFWIESMVREDARRQLLFDLDTAILSLRSAVPEGQPDPEEVVKLTGCYHNLLRMWIDT